MLKEYIDWAVPIFIGVVCGEILFQNNRHMVFKWRNTLEGWLNCLEHSILYTACVLFFTFLFLELNPFNLQLVLYTVGIHFLIEKSRVNQLWTKYIKTEPNPIQIYFDKKIYEKYGNQVNVQVYTDYMEKNKVLEIDENLLNSQACYVTEIYLVTVALHFVSTYFGLIALKFYNVI